MKAKWSWLAVGIGLLWVSAAPAAQQICNEADLGACAGNNLKEWKCLNLYHACGRYREIVDHYRSEAWLNDEQKSYYLGVAYYGLYVQNRSAALRCEYGLSAKQALQSYLAAVQGSKTKLNEQRVFRQTYHAAKALKELGALVNCPETAVTRDELAADLTAYGRAILEDLFIGKVPKGDLGAIVKDAKVSIQAAIQGFISKAAAIETQLNLRAVAIDQNFQKMKTIGDMLSKGFNAICSFGGFNPADGKFQTLTVTKGPGNLFDKTLGEYTAPVTGHLSFVNSFQAELNEALGASSIDDYEKTRDRIVALARSQQAKAAFLVEQVADITPQSTVTSLKSIGAAADEILQQGGNGEVLASIQRDWQDYGKEVFACAVPENQKPWYCRL